MKNMINYNKVEEAKKLLEESGAQYMLAYDKGDKNCSSRVNGEYPTIKKFVATVMWQAIEYVHSKCGGGMAASEAIEITSTVIERMRAKEESKQE
jgi:hypothetical protein